MLLTINLTQKKRALQVLPTAFTLLFYIILRNERGFHAFGHDWHYRGGLLPGVLYTCILVHICYSWF